MANTLQDISFDRTSTTTSRRSQGPLLNKLKSGLVKFINKRRHSSIVDTFRPSKHHYSPTRQDSSSDNDIYSHYDDDDDNDSEDDLDSINDIRINSELQHSIYSKDDDVERIRYNKAACYHHQRNLHPSTVSIPSQPPTILVKRSSAHSSTNQRHTNTVQNSQHRYTNSLQSSSIISTSGSSTSGKPAHYHHSRHYSHISFMSNMTVNSEDLTAKEFADMTGIRIIPDDDDEANGDQPDDMAASSTTMATSTATSSSLVPGGHQQRPAYYLNQPSDETDWSVVSSGSHQSHQSVSATAAPATTKIWDTGFWRQPCTENPSTMPTEPNTATKTTQQQQFLSVDGIQPTLKNQRSALLQHRQTLSLPSPMASTTPCQHTKSKSNCEFPIIHELRRIHSTSNNSQQHIDSSIQGDSCVIRKGRFEIQLEP